MTTYVAFAPAQNQPFSFAATLDGATYNCICTWNLFGQRWYVSCYDQYGTLVFSRPRIGSPDGFDLPISAGFFNDVLLYRESSGNFEIGGTLNQPTGYLELPVFG